MPQQIAVKLLRASDLTLFHPIWKRDNEWHRSGELAKVSKQKAINLNAREFLDQLYPAVRVAADLGLTRINLAMTVLGPNGAGPHNGFTRKVVRSPGSKNWRLNGETIPNPDEETTRYDVLVPGDIALIKFEGEPQPDAVTLVLLASAADEALEVRAAEALRAMVDDTAMITVGPDELAAVLTRVGLPLDHPAWLLAADPELEAAVEAAAEGDPEPFERVRRARRRAGGGATLEQIRRARAVAEATGSEGEALAAIWLSRQCDPFEWVAKNAPLSPFDVYAGGGAIPHAAAYVDVKSTGKDFRSAFFLSWGEAAFAAECDQPYLILRVFDLAAGEPKARLSGPVNGLARSLLQVSADMPLGTRPDGFTVSPGAPALTWGDTLDLTAED